MGGAALTIASIPPRSYAFVDDMEVAAHDRQLDTTVPGRSAPRSVPGSLSKTTAPPATRTLGPALVYFSIQPSALC